MSTSLNGPVRVLPQIGCVVVLFLNKNYSPNSGYLLIYSSSMVFVLYAFPLVCVFYEIVLFLCLDILEIDFRNDAGASEKCF